MAERYGGAYSPGRRGAGSGRGGGRDGGGAKPAPPAPRFRGRRAERVDLRQRLLYLLPTPLVFAVFGGIAEGDPIRTAFSLGAYASLIGGAWLLGEGIRAEAAYEARAVARRPSIPRKIMAAAAAGAGVAMAELAGSVTDLVGAVGFGGLATGAHLWAFGTDPLKNKGIDLSDAAAGRAADAVERAETRIAGIEGFAQRIADGEITRRLDALVRAARAMLARVEADPGGLDRARRYLSVYLVGAEEATRKYAETHDRIRDPALREDYLALIGELEASFARGEQKLLAADRTDLEVEIEVLRERLGQEVPR